MAIGKSTERPSNAFSRISKVLSYIHQHVSEPLSLDDIARQSCWSRWQLQRVFQTETGMAVATYVRELKLSQAAERLIDSTDRVIDIALELGFSSEISFSRSFKQVFGVSPRAYRKQGLRTGLRKPIEVSQRTDAEASALFVEVRVESKDEFFLKGLQVEINGLFSLNPDFQQKVPALWHQLEQTLPNECVRPVALTGVIDITQSHFDGSNMQYWAGVVLTDDLMLPQLPSVVSAELSTLVVPAQTYAVVKHRGPIIQLPKTLEWFLLNWLPNSGYRGIDGYELECYPASYNQQDPDAVMEYWIPVERLSQ
ncbi:AraC family transcriptional regulator [Vibrio coralliilyticus]|uniref:AraC family transcriptional regulator n=1 Tax=Vibrio coralliilyticus TaxID=190893 RepID=UPI00156194CA|nr:AraC family transcriptional regulator [Vibrio coralliilyticus]NRF64028.1 AraC family transcriptional regulator [Vibrio coralliilyticus]